MDIRCRIDTLLVCVLLVALSTMFACGVAQATGGPTDWYSGLCAVVGNYSPGGCAIGTNSRASDSYNGVGAMPLDLADAQSPYVQAACYRQYGEAAGDEPTWLGPTGFYGGDMRAPIPAGGSKSFWGIYLWSYGYAPDPPGQISVNVGGGPDSPVGYTARLFIDQIPESVNWTGPTSFWLDLRKGATFTLPIAEVTDPLQGTKMHITVYAVPEPSSLLMLGLGLLPLTGAALRRMRST